jgi:spore coat protein A
MPAKWETLTSTANANHSLFETSGMLSFGAKLRPHTGAPAHLTLHEKMRMVEVHPALGATTPIWGYEGKFPGPTIEVDSGSEVRIKVVNKIVGNMPYPHVVVDDTAGGSMNDPGTEALSADSLDLHETENVSALNAWTVMHLHGAPAHPDSDGWTDNMIGNGEHVEMVYRCDRETYSMAHPAQTPGDDPVVETYKGGAAPMYWYHDHAMSVTRFNVFSGLAGGWLVRDPVEALIGLPMGEFELPLILQDRNFETADGTVAGDLTGRFLHKVQTGVRECFAPATIVNGKLWPRAEVKKRVYRLRIVNGANARVYRLHFMGMKTSDENGREKLASGLVQQIGTDGGLLGTAVDLPDGSLVLSPGERADLLLDFGQIALDGYQHVVVYNSAGAPFNGEPLGNDESAIYTGDRDQFREFPQVMRFDLQGNHVHPGIKGHPIEHMALDPEFKRLPIDHALYPADHGHSLIALREEDVAETDPETGEVKVKTMLFLHEMMDEEMANKMGMNMHAIRVPDPADPTQTVPAGIKLKLAGDAVTYVTVAKRFNDMTSIFIEKGAWHLWKVINLSPDTHPFHIHLVQFQAIKRKRYPASDPNSPIDNTGFEFSFVETPADAVIDENEAGWKDTIRVNPGDRDAADKILSAEMVTVAAQFNKHAGRYMYHCHILEHEDSEMMRSFVVVPKETMPFMSHMNHHHHAAK